MLARKWPLHIQVVCGMPLSDGSSRVGKAGYDPDHMFYPLQVWHHHLLYAVFLVSCTCRDKEAEKQERKREKQRKRERAQARDASHATGSGADAKRRRPDGGASEGPAKPQVGAADCRAAAAALPIAVLSTQEAFESSHTALHL